MTLISFIDGMLFVLHLIIITVNLIIFISEPWKSLCVYVYSSLCIFKCLCECVSLHA